jgi:hypothetical protein
LTLVWATRLVSYQTQIPPAAIRVTLFVFLLAGLSC